MQSLLRFPLVVTMFVVCGIGSVADACYCGAARYRCCRQASCTPCCSQPCCTVTVMRTCREVVYDEVEQTCYKTVFEEVVEKVPVDAVKYVEGTAYRCAPCTVMQPCQPPTCGPAKTCAPAACSQPAPCCDMAPVQVLRKVSYPTANPQHYQKMEERKRVVEKQVPYKITVCVPRVVYKQVPVTICCPLPSCCAMPSGCNK